MEMTNRGQSTECYLVDSMLSPTKHYYMHSGVEVLAQYSLSLHLDNLTRTAVLVRICQLSKLSSGTTKIITSNPHT